MIKVVNSVVRLSCLKKCSGCKIKQKISNFTKDSSRKSRLKIYCKTCCNIKAKEQYKEMDKDKKRVYESKYYYDNLEKERRRHKLWMRKNREKAINIGAAIGLLGSAVHLLFLHRFI